MSLKKKSKKITLKAIRFTDRWMNRFHFTLMPRDRILSAISPDGIKWKREKGVRIDILDEDRADMVYFPTVLAMRVPEAEWGFQKKGATDWLMVYYGSQRDENGWTGTLYQAHSTDGQNWIPKGKALHEEEPSAVHLTSPSLASDESHAYLTYVSLSKTGEYRLHSVDLSSSQKIDFPGLILPRNLLDVSVQYFRNLGWFLYFTVEDKGKTQIFVIQSMQYGAWDLTRALKVTLLNGPRIFCNPSLVKTKEGVRVFFRGGDRPVLNNAIFTALSQDGIHFSDAELCLKPDLHSDFERHGLGFPSVTPLENGFRMYYAGFWGRSLLSSRAVKHWEVQNSFL